MSELENQEEDQSVAENEYEEQRNEESDQVMQQENDQMEEPEHEETSHNSSFESTDKKQIEEYDTPNVDDENTYTNERHNGRSFDYKEANFNNNLEEESNFDGLKVVEEEYSELNESKNVNESTNRTSLDETTIRSPSAETKDEDSALDLHWVFGMNKDTLGGMHNLCDETRKEVFYIAGNVGIIYKYETKEQILLQGHTNMITCSSVSTDKKWIVTADSGKENMIVVWDSIKGIPVKTIFDPHPIGIQSLDISSDSLYIYSLSKPNSEGEQHISLWEWTEANEGALVTVTVPSGDPQTLLRCHNSNPKVFLTNGPKSILFWEYEDGALEFFSPTVTKSDFGSASSEFVQTTFVAGTTMAASGTTDGEIVLWERKIYPDRESKEIEKEAMKFVKIHPGFSVNFITCIGSYIVTGGSDGFVKFLDHKLRLEAWFEEFDLGPITSISFDKNRGKQRPDMAMTEEDLENMVRKNDEFYCPDFIIQTRSGFLAKASSSSFSDYDVEGMKGRILVISQNESIQTLAVHPSKPYLAISGMSGNVHIWDYQLKDVLKVMVMKGLCVSSLAFDNKGEYLAVGCMNGHVKFFDAVLFTEIPSLAYRPSKACIQSLKFSHDSLFLAFSDSDNCVGVFKFMPNPQKKGAGKDEWIYIGRFKSHKKAITGLEFGVEPYGDIPRLMSVSEDRRLIEYDLENSSIQGGLKVKTIHRVSQDAIPTAFLWTKDENVIETYPNEKKYFDGLLFANDQYKIMSFITPFGNRDTRCNRTILSPTYGGPLNRLLLVPNIHYKDGSLPEYQAPRLLAYSTFEKVIGLIALPLDGNPKHHMGLIAHSGEITSCVVSPDGKYLFTAGGSDCIVNQWEINGTPLFKNKEIDEGIEPYVSLIEGGAQGEFFQEVQQYFYYAQIRSQGEITTSERKITGSVPINQVPDLVRSLGFYATQWEIQNMINELRVIKGVADPSETNSSVDKKRSSLPSKKEPEIFIDFNTFVKIYVNHRPVFGIQRKDIEEAFQKLGSEPITGFINKSDLFQKLKTMGEIMTENELNDCLSKLLKEVVTISALEERFTSVEFAEKLLGFTDGNV
ncbi:hypothetical protein FDP41_007192 [Naegleria fowleri]|uniref:Cilia- and flagella-associated protein 251 n=1 Tax=Naegleria fowleri TaxID=5763 RepID=A0A6A5BJK0_NAEFO|nr:uncharacterized protein FDP41_007192 [Naegleria fowleri]KAF0973805.1 hypothetical protein FDP41_007192 [Naegleria fowleri]